MNIRIAATALVLCAVHSTATAGTAVIEAGDDKESTRVTLEYRPGLLRMQPQENKEEGTMIVRDGKMYSIAGGMVIEMGSMINQLGKSMPMAQTPGTGPDNVSQFVGIRKTGRSETVAGIKGDVHEIQYKDENGRLVTEEAVLTRDARAREMRQAMELMSQTMRAAVNRPETAAEKKMMAAYADQGVLRYGSNFRVVSLSDETPPASRFELPAKPTQMPNLGELLGGGGAAAGANASANADVEAGSSGGGISGVLGGLFGNKAERQQGRVEQRVEIETDQATDEAVDGVLDKAMDKLFGR